MCLNLLCTFNTKEAERASLCLMLHKQKERVHSELL